MHKARSGFTIVELLIVIVVIAILASITVVAYQGIQSRAYYAKLGAAVNTYAKAFTMYKISYGSYPSANWACLGQKSDYPAKGEFGAGVCLTDGATYNEVWDQDIANDVLMYLSNLPDGSYPPVHDDLSNSHYARGLEYDSVTNGYTRPTITYYIDKTHDCPVGEVAYGGYTVTDAHRCVVELP